MDMDDGGSLYLGETAIEEPLPTFVPRRPAKSPPMVKGRRRRRPQIRGSRFFKKKDGNNSNDPIVRALKELSLGQLPPQQSSGDGTHPKAPSRAHILQRQRRKKKPTKRAMKKNVRNTTTEDPIARAVQEMTSEKSNNDADVSQPIYVDGDIARAAKTVKSLPKTVRPPQAPRKNHRRAKKSYRLRSRDDPQRVDHNENVRDRASNVLSPSTLASSRSSFERIHGRERGRSPSPRQRPRDADQFGAESATANERNGQKDDDADNENDEGWIEVDSDESSDETTANESKETKESINQQERLAQLNEERERVRLAEVERLRRVEEERQRSLRVAREREKREAEEKEKERVRWEREKKRKEEEERMRQERERRERIRQQEKQERLRKQREEEERLREREEQEKLRKQREEEEERRRKQQQHKIPSSPASTTRASPKRKKKQVSLAQRQESEILRVLRCAKDDHYAVLSLSRESIGEKKNSGRKYILKQFRKLALLLHPDKNKSGMKAKAETAFQRLSCAREVLSSPSKRAAYHSARAKKERQQQHQRASRASTFSTNTTRHRDGGDARRQPRYNSYHAGYRYDMPSQSSHRANASSYSHADAGGGARRRQGYWDSSADPFHHARGSSNPFRSQGSSDPFRPRNAGGFNTGYNGRGRPRQSTYGERGHASSNHNPSQYTFYDNDPFGTRGGQRRQPTESHRQQSTTRRRPMPTRKSHTRGFGLGAMFGKRGGWA